MQVLGIVCLIGLNAQHGPPPPRFSIPGAVPVPVRQPIPYRNERLVGPGVVRVRRPLAAPVSISRPATLQSLQAHSNLIDEAKPVTEENESSEIPTGFIPQQTHSQPQHQTAQSQQQPQPQFTLFEAPKSHLPTVLYSTDGDGQLLDQPQHHQPQHQLEFIHPTTPRFVQPQPEHIVPTTLRTTVGATAQRFGYNPDAGQTRAIQSNPKPVVSTR